MIYEYKCMECGEVSEVDSKYLERTSFYIDILCPECNRITEHKRLYSLPNLNFNGNDAKGGFKQRITNSEK